jgi:hypothetical protein
MINPCQVFGLLASSYLVGFGGRCRCIPLRRGCGDLDRGMDVRQSLGSGSRHLACALARPAGSYRRHAQLAVQGPFRDAVPAVDQGERGGRAHWASMGRVRGCLLLPPDSPAQWEDRSRAGRLWRSGTPVGCNGAAPGLARAARHLHKDDFLMVRTKNRPVLCFPFTL